MKPPRFSISNVMLVVIVFAANCAWLRTIVLTGKSTLGFPPSGEGVLDLGIFAMSNILLLGLYRMVSRRNESQPFLFGFVLSGVLTVLGFMGCCWAFPRSFAFDLVLMGIQTIHNFYMDHLPDFISPFDPNKRYPPVVLWPLVSIYTTALVIPHLLIALVSGLLARSIAKWRSLVPVR